MARPASLALQLIIERPVKLGAAEESRDGLRFRKAVDPAGSGDSPETEVGGYPLPEEDAAA
jgi:hypothetical protein